MSWLIDNQNILYILLGIVALGLLVALWRTRKRGYALAMGAVAALAVALALLLWLLSFWFESDQSKIVRAINGMRAAVQRGDTEGIFKHIARDFRVRSMDRASFRQAVEPFIHNHEVQDVEVWDFEPAEVKGNTATMAFQVKPKTGSPEGDKFFGRCVATFVLEDGQWRLKGFEVFNPLNNEPLPIPHIR
jgi:predicted membrane metal-binding protein